MTDTLRELWPEAYLVRIVRDPRDVALSLAQVPFAKESVVGNLVRIDQDDRDSHERIEADERAMTLRYEDLVTRPEDELRRVCAFIGEAYEPAMLDSRSTASTVAAEHEWWKQSVSGPLSTQSVGRWQREMSADARRFAALHLADYLRRHGYEGAQEPRREIALVPVGAAVGPHNEVLLLELARRGMVVQRPEPTRVAELSAAHAQGRLVYLGTRGQLDPSRGRGTLSRALALAASVGGLPLRRVQGRPVPWLRRNTLRPKLVRDPVERAMGLLLRVFAREVTIAEVPALVDDTANPRA
jgi:hypothetical protein